MAAPSTAGRVFTLCKQFLNVVRISSAVNTRLCPANASKFQSPLNSLQVGFQCLLCSGMTTGQGVFIGMLRRDECYHHHISAVRIRSSSLAILFSATIFQFTINHRTSDFKKLVQPARVPSADVSSLKHDRKQVESICKLINNPTIAGFNVWVEKERKGSAMDGKELNIFEIHNGQLSIKREKSILPGLTWYTPTSYVGQCRALHTTISRRGLEDFFDLPENWGETNVKSGAPWTAKQLRTKSNEDLHKLWYVLLKERNMLLTLEQEARRQRVQMPSPERIRKIERSMIRLETVVKERETALRLLQTGQEKGRPGAWRRNVFGYVYWYRFKEYAIPWFMNRNYRRKKFYTPKFVEPHIRLRIEKYLRAKSRKANLEKKTQAKLNEKFPQMKVSAS